MSIKTWLRGLSAVVLSVILSVTLLGSPAHAYLQSDYDQLLDSKGCFICDLSDADLSGQDLHDVFFVECNLSNANLSGANLTHAYLNSANLERANFFGATLDHAVFLDSDLSGATLPDGRTYSETFDLDDFGADAYNR